MVLFRKMSKSYSKTKVLVPTMFPVAPALGSALAQDDLLAPAPS